MAKTVGLTFPVEHIADENGDISFDKMTVTQLRKYAKDNGIDIGSAAKKDEIILPSRQTGILRNIRLPPEPQAHRRGARACPLLSNLSVY